MMTKEVKTSGGYTATIGQFLTYDEYVEIQRVYSSNATIDTSSGKPEMSKMMASVVYDAQKKAISLLVKEIKDPDGNVMQRASDSLPIPAADGQEIVNAITAITTEATESFDKKKVMTS